jgi:Xaa-Pro aminopeptidase
MGSSSAHHEAPEGQAPSAAIFQARHERLRGVLAAQQLDALVVAHLPNLTYITGFSGSAGLLVVTPARLYLLIDFRYSAAVDRAAEAGALAPALEAVAVETGYDRRLVEWLAERTGAESLGGVGPGGRRWRIGFEAGHVPVARYDWWRRTLESPGGNGPAGNSAGGGRAGGNGGTSAGQAAPIEWVPIERVVEDGRLVKDAHETALLREGARRLSAVARDVLLNLVRPGRTEAEIAADIDWRLRHAGFSRPAFDTIVAAGPNSALPHAQPTWRPLERGDLVLLDFGGVYGGYCVDLTRTVGLSPVPVECRRLFDAVRDAQEAAIAAAKRPGATTGEVDAAARDLLATRGLAEMFGHGTGHGLGLEIHEAPRLSRRTADHPGETTLEAGMVFTIEPGAYVPGLGGVRIEDDVLVTPEGCELLTDVPREWLEL